MGEPARQPLLIVTEHFEVGGVETYIADQIRALSRLGQDVHLVCGKRFDPLLLPEEVASVTSGVKLEPDSSIEDFRSAVALMSELVRTHGIGAIHAHPFASLVPAMACAEYNHLPLVVTLHGPSSVVGSYGAGFDFVHTSLILPRCSRVLVVSEEIRYLAAPFVRPESLHLQFNAVEIASTDEPSGPAESSGSRWLLVSRLDEQKIPGVHAFIRAAMDAGLAGVDVCGWGDAHASLQEVFAAEISTGRVLLLGPRSDARTLMDEYAGVAGMGRVVLEALSRGMPTCLVGYDGVKGLVDSTLFHAARRANFSGRGLESMSKDEAVSLLAAACGPSPDQSALQLLVEQDHASSAIWADFAVHLDQLQPVAGALVFDATEYLERAGVTKGPFLWSSNFMDALGRFLPYASDLRPGAQAAYFNQALVHSRETAAGETRIASERLAVQVASSVAPISGRLERLGEELSAARNLNVELISVELRRMQEVTAEAVRSAASLQRECDMAGLLAPRLDALERAAEASRNSLVLAISAELRHMQAVTAAAVEDAAGSKARAESLEAQSPAMATLSSELERALHEARENDRVARATQAHCRQLEDLAGERQNEADATRALADRLREERDDVVAQKRTMEGELEAAGARAAALLAELHAARHECSVLRESDRTLRQVIDSRSWRWTRPLRAGMRLLRGDWSEHESAALRGTLRRMVGRAPGLSDSARTALIERTLPMGSESVAPARLPDQAMAPAMHLAAADEGLADVFVWAVIDWHFRMQRPQHLARSLAARGHRVFYISNNFVDSAGPGFHLDPLDPSGRLFQVHLNLTGAPAIYFGLPAEEQVRALHASLAELLGWTHTRASISLVQHPYWSPLLRSVPNAQMVYDCMDHHGGFENNAACVLEAEEAIIRDADLVIVTSSWLEQEIAPNARATAMIRNAGEYDFFSAAPGEVFRDPRGRQVIGYYGAIAEWFDLDLVRAVARAHPQALVLLVGNDTAGAAATLADVPNVEFTGEVPYARLPYYLYGFDVALLPFQVIPLTLATNPVKVYEYLAAGRPVVSVDLPEMVQFDGLVTVAGSAGFADAVGRALSAAEDPARVAARRAFAAGQTWDHRAASLDQALAQIQEPVVSVVVLTYNNLAFTEACLFSIEAYSDYPALEVIVVDNASSDGSPEWLRGWEQERSAAGHRRRLILNPDNLGFSAGNNVGLAAATGEVLVLLNNDTYVTPGWVRTLCAHLRRDAGLGLVGPITNNIGNEARIEIQYADLTEMIRKAGEYTRAHAGRSIPMHNAAFFCVAMPRAVYERVGPMDEDFGVGFFEDDDYCRRVHLEGYRVACAEDAFVHHHLSASFDSLGVERKQRLFEKNKAIYEAKWGPWTPHVYRAEDKGVES